MAGLAVALSPNSLPMIPMIVRYVIGSRQGLLVAWIWLGGAVMTLGTLVALRPLRARAPREA